MTKLAAQTLEAPQNGLDTEGAAALLPAGYAPEHANFLVHYRGKAPMRGPLASHPAIDVPRVPIAGAMRHNNRLLIGHWDVADDTADAPNDGDHEPWVVPYRPTPLKAALTRASAGMSLVDLDNNSVEEVLSTKLASVDVGIPYGAADPRNVFLNVPCGRSTQIGAFSYAFAANGSEFTYNVDAQTLDDALIDPAPVVTPSAQQDSTLYPGTLANDTTNETGGTEDWANINNAGTIDGVDASWDNIVGPGAYHEGAAIKATNFGFAIPTDATITGIRVTARHSVDNDIPFNITRTHRLRLVKAGTIQSTLRTIEGIQDPYGNPVYTVDNEPSSGSTTELWGTTWTPADINNSGFGVAYSPYVYRGYVQHWLTDFIRITVFYTTPGSIVDVAADPAAAANLSEGTEYARRLLRWDGSPLEPYVHEHAIEGGQDVRAHLNKLFVLGGRDTPSLQAAQPDPIPPWWNKIEPSTLFWTIEDGPINDEYTEWQDPVEGTTNKITVDSDNEDFGVGLAKVGQNLAILKRKSLHVLYGYSEDTFTVKTISSSIGCVDRRSIVEADEGMYFLSDRGLYFYDGSQLKNVSTSVQSVLRSAVENTVGQDGPVFGRAEVVKLDNNYLLLTICNVAEVAAAVVQSEESRLSLLYHTPSGRWSSFSSLATNSATPIDLLTTPDHASLFDGRNLATLDALTSPTRAPAADRGKDTVAATEARIPSRWRARVLELASPLRAAQLQRILMDYVFQTDAPADNQGDGWYVTVYRGDGSIAIPEFQVPAQGDPSSFLARRRITHENFTELQDAIVVVEWKADGTDVPTVLAAEIHNTVLEFQPSYKRPSS